VLLSGTRVVELAIWVAGPSAGGILSDWGADVVKLEAPAGDPMRRLFATIAGLRETASPPFDLDNRGKRSVAVDLGKEEGRALARRLIARADVFLSNLRPDALARLGLDYASLAPHCPRLVYAAVTGYGQDGPERDRAAYDVGAFWARSGIATSLVPPGVEPPGARGGLGDHVTGITAVSGILGALLARERTGRGQLVDVSLFRTGLYCLGWDLGIQLRFGKLAPTPPRERPLNPMVNSYRAGDGRWFWLLGLEAERHWPKLVAVAGEAGLADDPRFASPETRRRNANELVARLDALFAKHPLDEWGRRFDEADFWWAPVQEAAEVVADPQADAAGAFVDVPEGRGAPAHRAVATPVRFGAADVRPRAPVPGLGEHTDEVLAEAGLAPAEIERLRTAGVIAG
jgi:crotonobetainyl-CoA:carnitine CoA-transferase CaiB-like acyl-CoA transferase